jgi:hypothetical protein
MLFQAIAAMTVAALLPNEVVLVDTSLMAVIRRTALPGPGLGLVAAPDGRVVVPLADEDGTAVVNVDGSLTLWKGRLFPLFFDEWDRMHVVMPGALATLSYPDRLLVVRVPVPELLAVDAAATSRDGRVLAVASDQPRSRILIASMKGDPELTWLDVPAPVRAVAVSDDGAAIVAALADGQVTAFAPGQPVVRTLAVGDVTTALAWTPDTRTILVSATTPVGPRAVSLRLVSSKKNPFKERFRTPLPAAAPLLAANGSEVVAVCSDRLQALSRGGKIVGHALPLPGVKAIAVIPDKTRSSLPEWSER